MYSPEIERAYVSCVNEYVQNPQSGKSSIYRLSDPNYQKFLDLLFENPKQAASDFLKLDAITAAVFVLKLINGPSHNIIDQFLNGIEYKYIHKFNMPGQ